MHPRTSASDVNFVFIVNSTWNHVVGIENQECCPHIMAPTLNATIFGDNDINYTFKETETFESIEA